MREPRERHERRLVNAVVVESFVNRLGFGIVTFALPLYALELGMSIAEVGLVVAAKALLQPAVKPFVGMAIDRWGTRSAYLGAVVFRLLASVVLLAVATPAGLYAVRLLQGVASAAQDPVSISVLAKGRTDRVGRRFSLLYGARDVGKVSAGLVAGLLLAATGSFQVVWAVVVALATVPLAIVWFFVRELPDAPSVELREEPVSSAEDAGRILRSPALRTIAALGLLGGMTAHMTHAMFQVYASEVAGLSNAEIGVIYSASVAALLVVGPLAGWLGDRRGHGLLASVRGVANAASSIIYLLLPSFAGMFLGRVVDDSGKAAFRPTWGALVARSAQDAGRRGGRTAANLDAWLSLGEALGPLVAALIWDTAGFVWFLVTRAVLGVAVELVLGRRLRRLLRTVAVEPEVPELRPGPGHLELQDVRLPGSSRTVDLAVAPGEVVAVDVGEAEVEHLLQVLAGGKSHDDGHVVVDGQDLATHRPRARHRAVGVLSDPVGQPDATVEDVLRDGCPGAAAEDLVHAWRTAGLSDRVPLEEGLRLRVGELDEATKHRVAVARAVTGYPGVLVLDERVAGAEDVAALVQDLVRRHRGGVLSVRVTQSPGTAVTGAADAARAG